MLVNPVVADGKCNGIVGGHLLGHPEYVTAVVGNKGTSVNLTLFTPWVGHDTACDDPGGPIAHSIIVPLDDCFRDHYYYAYNATSGIVNEILYSNPNKFRGGNLLTLLDDDVKYSKDFPKDVIRSGGLGVCGDPCLHSTDCALNLFCHEESTVCVDKDTKFMLGEHCNAVSTKSKSSMENDVAFNKCSCNLVHKAECAGAVAGCAIACAGSFGPACVSCIGVIGGCCDCASALFGFDCSHC